mmetsp:Transcript_10892/g.33572  ORF Transcript_10892/g.33572 Transcript_10892/m.33572 type:complete len:130 (+) Transcript_10892:136-525(+)
MERAISNMCVPKCCRANGNASRWRSHRHQQQSWQNVTTKTFGWLSCLGAHWHGTRANEVRSVLAMLESLGIRCDIKHGGRLYPRCVLAEAAQAASPITMLNPCSRSVARLCLTPLVAEIARKSLRISSK